MLFTDKLIKFVALSVNTPKNTDKPKSDSNSSSEEEDLGGG